MESLEKDILTKAHELVYGDREKAYGHPRENWKNIAELWNAYYAIRMRHILSPEFKQKKADIFNPIDVAVFNILQKVARIGTNPHHMDSWCDIAGYAAAAERIIRNT